MFFKKGVNFVIFNFLIFFFKFFIVLAEMPILVGMAQKRSVQPKQVGTIRYFLGMFWRSTGTDLMTGTVYFPCTGMILTFLVFISIGQSLEKLNLILYIF